jgi:hypothetical protein
MEHNGNPLSLQVSNATDARFPPGEATSVIQIFQPAMRLKNQILHSHVVLFSPIIAS